MRRPASGWTSRARTGLAAPLALTLSMALGCGGDDGAPADAGGLDATVGMDGSRPPPDAGEDGLVPPPPTGCTADAECDDSDACTLDWCAPEGRCRHDGRDADGDGHVDAACGGDDCDDGDALRYPGRTEVCDPDSRDEDCDPITFGVRDGDADGSPDARCCNVDAAGDRRCGTDCDDTRADVGPTGSEVCDGLDNDCDGDIDEGVGRTFYPDADGDGYGTADPAATPRIGCFAMPGYADSHDDCDDTPPDGDDVHPGAPDLCDPAMRDEDCDGTPNNPPGGCSCSGAATRACPLPGACAAGVQQCSGGMWPTTCSIEPAPERCNGVDDDCDGVVDDGARIACFTDGDNDGYAASGAMESMQCSVVGRESVGGCPPSFTNRQPLGANVDCNDADASVRPGALEACDGVDNDCNGAVDDGMRAFCYEDGDDDGYAPMGAAGREECPFPGRAAVGGCPFGATNRAPAPPNVDCDDMDSVRHPGAEETCNGRDDDCDGMIDESLQVSCYTDADDDTYAPMGATAASVCPVVGRETVGGCPPGRTNRRPLAAGVDIDCNDAVQTTHPGAAEACDGIDNDCSGAIDDGMSVTCYVDGDDDGYAASGALSQSQCPVTGRDPVGGCPVGWTNRAPSAPNIDCADADPARHPNAMEVCNGQDTDCDGSPDDGVTITCHADSDGDGYAPAGAATSQRCTCVPMMGWTSRAPTGADIDCDPADANQHPGAVEVCNHEDDDCDGGTDEGTTVTLYQDQDGDTWGSSVMAARCLGDAGWVVRSGDCADRFPDAHPDQASYFGTPYYSCVNPTWLCQDGGGAWHCNDPEGVLPCSLGAAATATYDYDCNGTPERIANGSCGHACMGPGGTVPCTGGNFFDYAPGAPPACGQSTTYVTSCNGTYNCAVIGAMCARTETPMPLRCR